MQVCQTASAYLELLAEISALSIQRLQIFDGFLDSSLRGGRLPLYAPPRVSLLSEQLLCVLAVIVQLPAQL
jgi:hypothetical protein